MEMITEGNEGRIKNMKTKNEAESGTELRSIEIDLIVPSRTNPRKTFPPETMKALTESIRAVGVQQPLIVRPQATYKLKPPDLAEKRWHLVTEAPDGLRDNTYHDTEALAWAALKEFSNQTRANPDGGFEIVAGERRWRAAKAAGVKCVPCLVRLLGDGDARQAQALENLQRVDLNPIEEAEGYRLLMTEDRLTVADLQAKLGRSRSHIFAKLALLKLCPAVKKAMEEGHLSASVGELIGRFEGPKEQERALKLLQDEAEMFADAAGSEPLSFRKASALLKDNFTADLNKATFDVKANYPGAPNEGACVVCLHRSANCRDTYPDVASPDVCTQPACYHQKAKLAVEQTLAPFRAKGLEVMPPEELAKLFRYGSFYGSKDYALETSRCYDDAQQRTMQKILGDALPKPVIALNANGQVVKLYKQAELQTALAAAGIKPKKDNQEGLITQAERKRTQEAEDEAAKRLLPLIHAALKLKKNERAAWRAVVRNVQDGTQCAAVDTALTLEGFKEPSLERVMDKMEPAQILRILALGTLFDYDQEPKWEYMQEMAKELGIDTKKLLKEVEKGGPRTISGVLRWAKRKASGK
jgi:ParB/RepB/Spo0J family partition protein